MNPLAKADLGQLQCYHPDVARKTCHTIASYQRTGIGTYDNKAIVPVGRVATLETHTPVTVKDGAVCGPIRAEDVMAGTLRVGDSVIAAERAKPVLERITQKFASLEGKEVCTRYELSGSDFVARARIAGDHHPDIIETIKWISPSDGYTVAH